MKENKKTILFISDDYRLPSGVGSMTREIIYGTIHKYNYIHIGVALNHPDKGKVIDCSNDIQKETGITDASLILYPYSVYGDLGLYRYLMNNYKIDALMIFTDPRQYGWLWDNEHEVRQKIPVIYYNIWDAPPAPIYNYHSYVGTDLLLNISRQTHMLVKDVIQDRFTEDNWVQNKTWCKYVPHGINPEIFKPLPEEELDIIRHEIFKDKHPSFIALWNNRNQRRKHPGNVILSFKQFLNKLPEQKKKECYLILHTQPIDENGTNLFEVRDTFMGKDKEQVLFHIDRVPPTILNQLYNLSDVTLNIASNEGFGLSSLESIMAGTMVINNTTGGLQDQVRFCNDKNEWITVDCNFPTNSINKYNTCGCWCEPVFPTSRSLVGSVPTPYIYDETYNNEQVSDAMFKIYSLTRNQRRTNGIKGRLWVISDEAKMTNKYMCSSFIENIDKLFADWVPQQPYQIIDSSTFNNYKNREVNF